MTDFHTTASTTTRHVGRTVETVTRRQGFRAVDHQTLAPASRYADYDLEGLLRVADPVDASIEGGARDSEPTVLVPELTRALARAVTDDDEPGREADSDTDRAVAPGPGGGTDRDQPARWRATGTCWRAAGARADDRREFRRTAALLVDADAPGSDAELLSLARAVLAACGLEPADATMRVSHRGLLAAVFEAFSGSVDVKAALSATAVHGTGTERYHDALVDAGMNYGQADTLSELLGLGAGDLDALADLTGSRDVAVAVDDLQAVLEVAGAGVTDAVAVSLPALPAQPYYTGLTLRVDGPDDHPPAIRAGRLDGLVGAADGDSTSVAGLDGDTPSAAGLDGDAPSAAGLEIDHRALARLRSQAR